MKFMKFLNRISLLSDKPKTEYLATIASDNLGFIRLESRTACVSSDENETPVFLCFSRPLQPAWQSGLIAGVCAKR
jgi:hypothetical protein